MEDNNYVINPNHASVSFKCKYHTKYGQHLRAVGNIEELGCWDPNKGMLMITNDKLYPLWESTQEITGPVGMEIRYKYVVYDMETKTFIWETLENNQNRKYQIDSSGVYILTDEEHILSCKIQKIMGHINSNGFEENEAEREYSKLQSVFENMDTYNSLSYDPNVLNGNELNDIFNFCLSVYIPY